MFISFTETITSTRVHFTIGNMNVIIKESYGKVTFGPHGIPVRNYNLIRLSLDFEYDLHPYLYIYLNFPLTIPE